MRAFVYIIIVAASISSFYLLKMIQEESKSVALLTEATRTDYLLLNSRTYLREGSTERSLSNLTGAINELNRIQSQVDSLSRIHLRASMDDLRKVLHKMESGSLGIEQLNNASILTLNALTFYQIKAAEQFTVNDEPGKAKIALGYGKSHIKNALILVESDKKEYEVQIYAEMDEIINDDSLSTFDIVLKLEDILHELEDLEVAYH